MSTGVADQSRVDEYLQVLPAPALRRYIGWYSGYHQRGLAPGLHRGLPSPYLTLIFTLDDPLTVIAHPDAAQPGGSYETLLGGLHHAPALITHDGAQSGVQVAMSPLGCRLLFGVPAGELASLDVPVDDVLTGFGALVRQRLLDADGWPERFAVLDDVLTARMGRGADLRAGLAPEVVRAWNVVMRCRGTVSAGALAAEVGWSGRHLASRFQQELGLTPKLAARVVRFDRARRLMAQPMMTRRLTSQRSLTRGGSGLAELAAACGYADQAHLTRDFRALSGCSPTQWLAAEVPPGLIDPGGFEPSNFDVEFRNVQDRTGPRVGA